MDPERWQSIRSIVEAALDLPPVERAAFLDRSCGADVELRREVEELLRGDEIPAEDLNPPHREKLWRRPPTTAVGAGADLGDFVIEQELGAGGMGVVYAARQKNPARRVALKMLRGGSSTPESLRRFRLESEVLARLQHPGIAQIHSAGIHEEDGGEVPWFAMELVEDAQPVTDHARERQLSLDQRLDLFASICDAVQRGHEKGVIHRDLKPGNVLVGKDGQPKVIDFGIARIVALDHTRWTEERTTAGLLGTLQSMSPEQAAGDPDLDVRSDVYSLGVLLYELLTDATPHDFHGKAVHEIARTVVEEPPRLPRSLAPQLPEDLEIVLLKSLEKERHRRYASARELAADLRRYRAHQPIEARRPSTVYQLTLFARRHRALVSASVVTLLALGFTLVWSLKSTRESRAAEQAAERARHKAELLRIQETEARALVQDLLDRSVSANVAFLRDFLDRVSRLPGSTQVSYEMLELTRQNLEFLAESTGGPGPAHDALARTLVRLGDLQGSHYRPSLGKGDEAGQSYTRALEIARALGREQPDSVDNLTLLAWCQGNLGFWHLNRNELDEARALLESEVQTLDRATLLSEDPEVLRKHLAVALERRSTIDGLQGDFEASLRHAERARSLYQQLLDLEPTSLNLAIGLAVNTGKCGMARFRSGDDSGIEDLLEECDMLEEVLLRDPHHTPALWLIAETRMILCEFEIERQELEAAREHGGEALAILEGLAEQDPASAKFRRLGAHVAFSLGRVEELAADDQDDPDQAGEHWLQAGQWFEKSLAWTEELVRERALPPHEQDHVRRIREHLRRSQDRVRQHAERDP